MTLPKITIVTPSLNQAQFLEATIQSILSQKYPALEYFIIDGGSSDGSVEIIRKYEDQLAGWISEPDAGEYDAINKGFARGTGEVMGWVNSDDQLLPWCLSLVGEWMSTFPEIEWLTTLYPLVIDRWGRATRCMERRGYSREAFRRGENMQEPGVRTRVGWIQQESTFWRRSLWERSGARLDTAYQVAGDFELWARFFQFAEIYGVLVPLGAFRAHGDQRSVLESTAYFDEVKRAWRAHAGASRGPVAEMLRDLAFTSCPRPLRGVAARLGLLYESRICKRVRNSDEWRIATVLS